MNGGLVVFGPPYSRKIRIHWIFFSRWLIHRLILHIDSINRMTAASCVRKCVILYARDRWVQWSAESRLHFGNARPHGRGHGAFNSIFCVQNIWFDSTMNECAFRPCGLSNRMGWLIFILQPIRLCFSNGGSVPSNYLNSLIFVGNNWKNRSALITRKINFSYAQLKFHRFFF